MARIAVDFYSFDLGDEHEFLPSTAERNRQVGHLPFMSREDYDQRVDFSAVVLGNILPYHVRIMTNEFSNTNRVRANRLSLGLSQAQLAEKAGVSRTAVTAIEGNRLVPSVSAAIGIAKALGQSVESLFGNEQTSRYEIEWESAPVLGESMFWRADVGGRMVHFQQPPLPC